MALNLFKRLPSPRGVRNVAKRLAYAKKQYPPLSPYEWVWFLSLVRTMRRGPLAELEDRQWFWAYTDDIDPVYQVGPEKFTPAQRRSLTKKLLEHVEGIEGGSSSTIKRVEAQLDALPASPVDALIPWLRREWLRILLSRHDEGADDPGTIEHHLAIRETLGWMLGDGHMTLPEVADWWLANRQGLDINKLVFIEAQEQSYRWHQELARRAEQERTAAAKKQLEQAARTFKRLRAWPDGVWLGSVDAKTPRAVEALRSIGVRLGHCYREAPVAEQYLRDYRMLVLFDAEGQPHVTLAVRGEWTVEVRGRYNMFPAERWWPYLADIFDILLPESPRPGWALTVWSQRWRELGEAAATRQCPLTPEVRNALYR